MVTRVVLIGIVLSAVDARADTDPPAEPPVQEITPDEPEPKPPPPKPEPVKPAAPPAPAPKRVTTMEELTIPKSFLRFGLNLFGDVSALATSPDKPHTGFAIGTVDTRFLAELGSSIDALAEIGFESGNPPVADIEQIEIRWRRGPGVLQVGRFHTDIGYWNTAYHHGLWLQVPIERPHIARFEDDGGLLPVHWIGAEYFLSGALGTGRGGLVLGVGNGRGVVVDDVRVAGDTNDAKAVHAKLRYRSSTIDAGVGAIYDVIAPAPIDVRPSLPDERIVELIGSAHLAIRTSGPIAVFEGHALHHRFAGTTRTTYGAYGLLGFVVTPWLTPYAAIDVIRGADKDPFFAPDPMVASELDVVEGLAGLRFETSTWSALKLEFQYVSVTHDPDPEGNNHYNALLNWSFGL